MAASLPAPRCRRLCLLLLFGLLFALSSFAHDLRPDVTRPGRIFGIDPPPQSRGREPPAARAHPPYSRSLKMSAEEVLARSAPQVASPALDQFILFGDSITQFASSQERGFAFQPAIQNEYIRRLDVINRGFSGYNTFNSLGLLPQFFPPATKERVRLMTVFFGANDAVLPPYEQHVPLDKYRQYLKDILTHEAVRAQNTKLLLLTPPPVNEYKLEPTPARSAATTKKYADACREVGTALKVPVVDIWAAFMKEAGWTEGTPLAGSKDAPPNQALEQLLYDGLHFGPAGYRVMFNEVMKAIRANYPEEAPEKLPTLFASWQQAKMYRA